MAGEATVMERAIVCRGALLQGKVTIGPGTIVHPSAEIRAEDGPIIIGENCLIEEQVVITNRASDDGAKGTITVMTVGNDNVFEVGSKCEATTMGDANVVESKATIGKGVSIGSNCRVGAMCTVHYGHLEDHTIIYGRKNLRRNDPRHVRPAAYDEQLVHLRAVLPKFHHSASS